MITPRCAGTETQHGAGTAMEKEWADERVCSEFQALAHHRGGKKRDAGKEKSSETAGARGEGGKGRRKGEEGRRRKTRKEDVMQGKRNRVKHLAEDEERGGCDGRKTESGETSGGDTVRSQPHSSPPDAYWNGNAL